MSSILKDYFIVKGDFYFDNNEYSKSISNYKKSLWYTQKTQRHKRNKIGYLLFKIARALDKLNNFTKAEEYYCNAYRIYELINSSGEIDQSKKLSITGLYLGVNLSIQNQ